MRRGQQAVDQLLISIRRGIGEERLHFGGARRQARKIKARAAQERDLLRIRRERELLLRHRLDEKRVNGSPRPILGSRGGNLRLTNRLERPEGALFFRDARTLPHLRRLRSRGLRAAIDPSFDERDLSRGQLLVALRHLTAVNQFEQRAAFRFAGNDHRTILAALQHQPTQTQIQPALQLLALAVAIEAVRLEDGPDVFLEGQRRRSEDRDGHEQPRTRDQQSDHGGPGALHALRRISFTTRQGFPSVMRCSWPF